MPSAGMGDLRRYSPELLTAHRVTPSTKEACPRGRCGTSVLPEARHWAPFPRVCHRAATLATSLREGPRRCRKFELSARSCSPFFRTARLRLTSEPVSNRMTTSLVIAVG